MIGRDLTRPEMQASVGRAIMQFNGTQAYMEGDQVAVLQKNLPASQYVYRGGHLTAEETVNPELIRKAIAHSAWSSMAYEKYLYRLPTAGD